MSNQYTDEKNVQVLIALLKARNVKKAILSPGSANSPLVASLQTDSFFECYSCVDERSAAYMACGLAEEAQEPVLLSCTGATASRNYLPGMTEAYYRKLPIIAVTSTQPVSRIGHHIAQVVDRSIQPNDTYVHSVTLPIIKDENDFKDCEMKVNVAVINTVRNGGGPVHINLQTNSLRTYTTQVLPEVRKIDYYTSGKMNEERPLMPKGSITIFVGAHSPLSQEAVKAIDSFCEAHQAAVICDHTSQYHGKFRVLGALIGAQHLAEISDIKPQLSIHIGEVSGDYYGLKLVGSEVWRVSPDGEIRDTFGRLTKVFEMPEQYFFENCRGEQGLANTYYEKLYSRVELLRSAIPEVPFSNIWVASRLAPVLPVNSTLHFGILNSLRSWNFFELDASIRTNSNTGGFGIDGCISTLCGASLCDSQKLYFGVFGDLAFFYDLNAIGNRHIRPNLRILLINNGLGTEFKTYKHHTSHFGDEADAYISAAGHFGKKSPELVKNYAENLGFEYLTASNKESFEKVYAKFIAPDISESPMLFEVFTDSDGESKALELMMNIDVDHRMKSKRAVVDATRQVLGKNGIKYAKKILGR